MEILTTLQVAELVGVSRAAILKAIHRGQLKATKVGSKRRGIWLISRQEALHYKYNRRPPGRPKLVSSA